MKKLIVAASLAAVACAPVWAVSYSSARILGVQVRVSDANASDGLQPSFGLANLPVNAANSADAMVKRGTQSQDSAVTNISGGNNLLLWDGNVSATAVYSGWSFNQTMSAGGQVLGDGADGLNYAYASSARWDSAPLFDGRLPFWVGPGTTFSLLIAAKVSAHTDIGSKVAANGSSFSEWAGAQSFVEIGMSSPDGSTVVTRQEFSVLASGTAMSPFQVGPLEVRFTNTSSGPISGYMALGVSAWGGSQVVAVPEPSSLACLAGGLALLFAAKRRRA